MDSAKIKFIINFHCVVVALITHSGVIFSDNTVGLNNIISQTSLLLIKNTLDVFKVYSRWFCWYCCFLETWLSYIVTFLFFAPWLGLLTAIPLHHNSFLEWPPRNESAMMDGPTPCALQCCLWYGQGSASLWWWPIYNNVPESSVTKARTCSTLSETETSRVPAEDEIRGSAVVLAW